MRRTAFLVLTTLGGVALCAIPFVGWLVGIIGGVTMLGLDRRDRRWARLHASAMPLRPIAEAVEQQQVKISGRVTTKATIRAPLSGRDVVYAVVSGKAAVRKGRNERAMQPRHLGELIEVDDGTGQAVIPLHNVHILSRHTTRHDEHNQPRLSTAREIFPVPDNHNLDLEEMTLEHGDEVRVLGRVTQVEEVVTDRAGGYRGSGREKRVTLGGPDGVRITNLTPEELARIVHLSPAFVAMGAVWLVAGLASLGYTGWMLLG